MRTCSLLNGSSNRLRSGEFGDWAKQMGLTGQSERGQHEETMYRGEILDLTSAILLFFSLSSQQGSPNPSSGQTMTCPRWRTPRSYCKACWAAKPRSVVSTLVSSAMARLWPAYPHPIRGRAQSPFPQLRSTDMAALMQRPGLWLAFTLRPLLRPQSFRPRVPRPWP